MFQRAHEAFIAAVEKPDFSFGFAHASQVLSPDPSPIKTLNAHIKRPKDSQHICLRYMPLDYSSVLLAIFCKLGYTITLVDSSNNASIIHYSSIKSKPINQSVLAAKLLLRSMLLIVPVRFVWLWTIFLVLSYPWSFIMTLNLWKTVSQISSILQKSVF